MLTVSLDTLRSDHSSRNSARCEEELCFCFHPEVLLHLVVPWASSQVAEPHLVELLTLNRSCLRGEQHGTWQEEGFNEPWKAQSSE